MDTLLDLVKSRLVDGWWAQLLVFVPLMAGVFVIERLLSARADDWRACWLNLKYIVVATAVNLVLLDLGRWLLRPGLDVARPWAAPLRDWALQAPVWLQFLAQVALLDFFYYWTHRFQHRYWPLWRFHELHHSEPHFNVTTTLRVHWLEELLKLMTVIIPASLLIDAPAAVPWLLATVGSAWLFFIHANARISYGPLNALLVSPAVHRVHHSVEPAHRDKNFAAYFSLWDVLFGTYHAPPRGRWPEVGTDDAPPRSALSAHLRPFRLGKPPA